MPRRFQQLHPAPNHQTFPRQISLRISADDAATIEGTTMDEDAGILEVEVEEAEEATTEINLGDKTQATTIQATTQAEIPTDLRTPAPQSATNVVASAIGQMFAQAPNAIQQTQPTPTKHRQDNYVMPSSADPLSILESTIPHFSTDGYFRQT